MKPALKQKLKGYRLKRKQWSIRCHNLNISIPTVRAVGTKQNQEHANHHLTSLQSAELKLVCQSVLKDCELQTTKMECGVYLCHCIHFTVDKSNKYFF